jgi:hypothetical protein
MGKTWKDQDKWEKKHRDNGKPKEKKHPKIRPYEETMMDEDEYNKYEYLEYEYDDDE